MLAKAFPWVLCVCLVSAFSILTAAAGAAPVQMPPERAVVLDPHLMLGTSYCAVSGHTEFVWENRNGDHPIFYNGERGRRHVWNGAELLPVEIARYPIMVFTYRARNTSKAENKWDYILWFYDGDKAVGNRGISAVMNKELIDDGEVHEIRVDLRTLKPRDSRPHPEGSLHELWMGLKPSATTPAELEFIGLRFEATNDTAPKQPYADAQPITFTVRDSDGRPVEGAKVTVDAQRLNFARSAVTDAQGLATITPLSNEAGEHMVRVESDGFARIECFDIKAGTKDHAVTLPRGVRYGGRVVSAAGEPIPNAYVHLSLPVIRMGQGNVNTLKGQRLLTDADGRWESVVMTTEVEAAQVRLAEWDSYLCDAEPRRAGGGEFTLQQLQAGEAVMVMQRGVELKGVVLGDEDKPISGAIVSFGDPGSYPTEQYRRVADRSGHFSFGNASQGSKMLAVKPRDYAPLAIAVTVTDRNEPVIMRVNRGRKLSGIVLTPEGEPVSGASISIDLPNFDLTAQTDQEGRWTWPNAPARDFKVSARKGGFRSVSVPAPADAAQITVKLQAPLTVRGKVSDGESGATIDEFTLVQGIVWNEGQHPSWMRHNARQFKNGRYEIRWAEEYPALAVRIEAEGYRPFVSRPIKVDEGVVEIDAKLSKGTFIEVKVLRPNGKPAARAPAAVVVPGEFLHIDNGIIHERNDVKLSAGTNGVLRVPAEAAPWKLIVAEESGYAEIDGDALEQHRELRLQPWASVEGVLHIGSKPGANQTVSATLARMHQQNQPNVHFGATSRTDDQGRFTITRIPAGTITLGRHIEIREGMYSVRQLEKVELSSGEKLQVNIGGKGRPVTGRIGKIGDVEAGAFRSDATIFTHVDSPNPPLPDSWTTMSNEQKQRWFSDWQQTDEGKAFMRLQQELANKRLHISFLVDSRGQFRIDDVPPGEYDMNIQLRHPDHRVPDGYAQGDLAGRVAHRFTVEPPPTGDPDAPVDLGDLAASVIKNVAVGDLAPSFEVATVDGGKIRLEDFRGKYVLLDFWATWCGPCIAETPNLKELFAEFGGNERFAMIGLSLDQDAKAPAEYAKKNDLGWHQGFLGEWSQATLPAQYGVYGIPSMWLIGPDGRVAAKNLRGDNIRAAVAKALGQ